MSTASAPPPLPSTVPSEISVDRHDDVSEEQSRPAGCQLAETPVLAWAIDRASGQPVYIGELDPRRNGLACDCECPACQQPLTAVNAGKAVGTFRRRPHFRHPAGTAKASCEVLVARAAVLQAFFGRGVITLPGRRWNGRRVGFDGQVHDVWIDEPAERVQAHSFSMVDRTTALLRLEDGRELEVSLLGSMDKDSPAVIDGGGQHFEAIQDGSAPRARIAIVVDDPAVAGMTPEQLRSRLTLVTEGLCWRHHWKDPDLAKRAGDAADALAAARFDFLPPYLAERAEFPSDLPRELWRESLLHLEVKRILAGSLRLYAPPHSIIEDLRSGDHAPMRQTWNWPPRWLSLRDVRLERRLGRLVPDVSCDAEAETLVGNETEAPGFRPLLIEVTVSNAIDEARMERIRKEGHAAIEIDLSRASGQVDRDTLEHLVLEDIGLKRWLYLPAAEAAREAIRAELSQKRGESLARQQAANEAALQSRAGVELPHDALVSRSSDRAQIEEQLRERLAKIQRQAAELADWPVDRLGEAYKQAIGKLSYELRPANEWRMAEFDPWGMADRQVLNAQLEAVVGELKRRGFYHAGDRAMTSPHGIVVALMSIQRGFPYGYPYSSVAAMIPALRRKHPPHEATLYLIALRRWSPPLDEPQQEAVTQWGREVWSSIKGGQDRYLRPTDNDALLGELFPDLAYGLADKRCWRIT